MKHDDFSYTCSGVPVDCVVHGLNAVLKSKPDVILSGINFGANLGTDILFSGTAAAARQASLYGIPGIAVSLESSGGVYDFSSLASFTVKNLEHLMSLSDKDIFVNINALSPGPYAECRLTKPSKRYYNDGVKPFIAPDGQHYSFFAGGNVETEGDEDCDYCVLKKGFVSVSRILSQPSAHPYSDSSWENHVKCPKRGITLYRSRNMKMHWLFFFQFRPIIQFQVSILHIILDFASQNAEI